MNEDFAAALRSTLQAHTPARVTQAGAIDAAVLIPIVAEPEPTAIFTVRTDTLSSHKGQISFPGGRRDPGDETRADTALRETKEEVGLDPSMVEVLGELDTFPTFVSGYVVTPIVGWLEREPDLTPNPAEVAEVLHVPLSELNDSIRSEPGFTHGGRTYPTEAWVWRDYVIWGVTARIVRDFLDVLAKAGVADPPGPTTSWVGFPPPEPT